MREPTVIVGVEPPAEVTVPLTIISLPVPSPGPPEPEVASA